MSAQPTVRVENQLVRFVPSKPIDGDLAIDRLGAIRQGNVVIHVLDTPRATLVIDEQGSLVVHGTYRMEIARMAAKEFLLRLGLSDDGLKTELGSIVATFRFKHDVKLKRAVRRLGQIARDDQRLGCVRISDTRHQLELLVWRNGKVIAKDAGHANLVAMAAVHWMERFEQEGLFEDDTENGQEG